jgi:hypothetical protein
MNARWVGIGLVVGTLGLAAGPLAAQVKLTGGLTGYGEMYRRTGAGLGTRPDQTGRITANLTIDLLNGLFTVPLTALIASDGVQFRQQINQFGISPTYRSVTVHLGTFTPDYSRYTFTDAMLTGGGIAVRRPGFRFGVVAGRAQRAIVPDTGIFAPSVEAQFERFAFGGRVGVGSPEASYFDVSFFSAEDDRGSLDTAITNNFPVSPVRNLVLGMKGRLAFGGGRVTLDAEAANSRFDPNIAVSTTDVLAPAVSGKILYNTPAWSLGGTVEYLGAGFKTLGNSGLADDRLDYGVTGRAQLGGGRLQLSGMGGWRNDNQSNALDATTSQAIYNVTATWQPGAVFGVDVQAANNVNNSRAKDDTSSVKNITGQYGFTPHLVWRTGPAQHVLVFSANFQRSDNSTPGSVILADTRTIITLGTWTVSFPSSLAFTAVATRTRVEVDSTHTKVTTVQPGVSYTFAKKVQVSLQAQFMVTEHQSGGDDTEFFPIGQVRYAFARGQSLQLRTSVRHSETATFGSFEERVVTLTYSAMWR